MLYLLINYNLGSFLNFFFPLVLLMAHFSRMDIPISHLIPGHELVFRFTINQLFPILKWLAFYQRTSASTSHLMHFPLMDWKSLQSKK